MAARNVLAFNIAGFHDGHQDLYRVVATELRKLFCDTPKCLVERLFPSAGLHPTRLYRPGEDVSGLVLQVPAMICVDEKGVRVTEVFRKDFGPLPVSEWLEQPFLSARVTLRDFIKSVADKESSHADPVYNETLLLAKSVHVGDGEELLGLLMVAVGEYVLGVLDMAIKTNPKLFPVRERPWRTKNANR